MLLCLAYVDYLCRCGILDLIYTHGDTKMGYSIEELLEFALIEVLVFTEVASDAAYSANIFALAYRTSV